MEGTTGLVASRLLDGLGLTEFSQHPRAHLGRHRHRGLSLFFTLSGSYVERTASSLICFGDNAFVMKPVDCDHSDVIGPAGLRGLLIEIEGDRFSAPALDRALDVSDEEIRRYALALWSSLRDGCTDRVAGRLAIELVRRSEDRAWQLQPPSWLAEVESFIRSHSSKRLEIGHLATIAGVSRSSLQRGFAFHYRQKIGEFIANQRLMSAMALLESSDLPIAAIAADCGFCDQSHLSRRFARSLHISPRAYRLANRTLQ